MMKATAKAGRLSRSSTTGNMDPYFDGSYETPKANSLKRYSRRSGSETPNRRGSRASLEDSGGPLSTPKKRSMRPGTDDGTGSPTRKFQAPPRRGQMGRTPSGKQDLSSTMSTSPGGASPEPLYGDENAYMNRSPRQFVLAQETKSSLFPVDCGEGKMAVSKDGKTDTRGGTSMLGPRIIHEQDDVGSKTPAMRKRFEEMVEKDKTRVDVKLRGFNDRFIRAQDGNAMKAIFSPREEAEEEPRHKHHHSSPLWNATAPAAGQANQVAQGIIKRAPYHLQTDFDGVMPTVNTLSLLLSKGNFKLRRDVIEAHKKEAQALYARQCEPEGKREDTLRKSLGVSASMNPAEDQITEDPDQVLRKELSRKGRPERQPPTNPMTEGNARHPIPLKDYSNRTFKLHHFSAAGGISCDKVRDHGQVIERETYDDSQIIGMPRKKLNMGVSALQHSGAETHGITSESFAIEVDEKTTFMRTLASPELRFNQYLQPHRRQCSLPPERLTKENIVMHLDTAPTDLSSNPRRKPSATPRDSRAIQEVFDHNTSAQMRSARELRKETDPHFANICAKSARCHQETAILAKSLRERNHHQSSSSVADLFQRNPW